MAEQTASETETLRRELGIERRRVAMVDRALVRREQWCEELEAERDGAYRQACIIIDLCGNELIAYEQLPVEVMPRAAIIVKVLTNKDMVLPPKAAARLAAIQAQEPALPPASETGQHTPKSATCGKCIMPSVNGMPIKLCPFHAVAEETAAERDTLREEKAELLEALKWAFTYLVGAGGAERERVRALIAKAGAP